MLWTSWDERTDRGKTVYPPSLSIDITEEGSDVGDDSDDEDFEPSLNFTLRFVMLISYVSFVTYILEILSLYFYRTWPWTTQRVCNFWLTLLKPMTKYQIAATNNYWEKCYEHLGTNGRTEVKQYTPPSSGAGV
jgi:hypothetical protein